jgi:hypothetical protein
MQGTAEFHHEIADTLLPQADPVLHNTAALDTAIDVLDAQPTLVSSWSRSFLVGMRIATSGSMKARNPRSCKSRLPAGKGYGVVSAMGLSWVWPP